jgi:serine/threonine protein kinase
VERAEGVVVAGRYRLTRKLGAGGMGSVWLAYDLSLDTKCAIKLVDDDKAKSEEVRVRFQREAKAAAQIRSPHVVDVFDHGEWSGVPYIAMEFLDGEDLGQRLQRVGRLDPGSTYRVISHVARALTRAHAVGIVHRDLKPENVFLVRGDDEEIAKVLDFGIAKHDAYSLQDKATKTGSFLGTPYYVSPEQARGKSTDYRSDLWSLGVIAFECLTGRPPFQADALGELMGQILYEDPPKPSDRAPGLLPAVDAWWERSAQRDREQRFQTAKELSDALGRALGVTRLVVVPSIPPRTTVTTPPPDGERSSAPPPAFPMLPALPVPAELRDTALPRDYESEPPTAVGPSLSAAAPVSEDTRDTDAPLSRTRHSLAIRFPNLRRRHLFAFAGGGVVLGVILTLILISGPDDPETPSALTTAGQTGGTPAARPIVTPSPEIETPPPPAANDVPPGNVHSLITEGEPKEGESRSEGRRTGRASAPTDSGARKRPPAPPAKPRKPASPDYGI